MNKLTAKGSARQEISSSVAYFLMSRENTIFDVAIIGGGIAGTGIARDAALRGLNVILFEKNTFGSGTSSKSSKLIHGGIRYLELSWLALIQLNFPEAWKNFCFVLSALKESAVLERIAPDLVLPIELVLPIYKRAGQSVLAIYFGTLLYGLLSYLSGNRRFPRILPSKSTVLKLIPNLNPKDLVGGVIIWDHCVNDKQLVEKTMASAQNAGTIGLEQTFVKSYQFNEDEKIYTLAVEQNNQTRVYQSRILIDASGPWVDKIRDSAHEKTEEFIVPVAGSHITLKQFTDYSVILQADDKRIFFVINLGSSARVGTTERIHKDPDTVKPTEQEVEYLLCALERYFPQIHFDSGDIISKDAGIRPLAKPKEALALHSISREHEIRIGPTGVVHVLGVKLTDHRRAAEDVVNQIAKELKLNVKSETNRIPL